MIINILFEHSGDGHPHGCSHIRLLRPLSHPSLQDRVRVIASRELAEESADVVIVERWWKPKLTESNAAQLVKKVRERGSIFIYTLDDNLLDLGLDEEGPPLAEELHRATRYFIREADGVLVSTPALKERLNHLNSNIFVIPNALDERLFHPEEAQSPIVPLPNRWPKRAYVTVGYMGTLTHAADLQLLIEPLRKLISHYREQVRFEIIGIDNNRQSLIDLFGRDVHFLTPGQHAQYKDFVEWYSTTAKWDIGLAPLTDRPFNRYKSDIKFLDYGALGIPGIFSNFGAYRDTVVHEKNGLLVNSDPDEWFDAMSRMVRDEKFRLELGCNAATYVASQRMLDTRAVCWYEAILSICDAVSQPRQVSLDRITLSRNEKVLYGCNLQGKGLEIGASYSPVAPKSAGYQVEILDHANATVLREKYAQQNVDVTRIEEVDYVWSGESIDAITGKTAHYDWIVASHVIEHTPDLVSFLQQCATILKPGGLLCLAVPDHRYCFDVGRPASTPGSILQAYFEKRRRHSFGAIWDHFSMAMKKGGSVSWSRGQAGKYSLLHPSLSDARNMLEQAQQSSEYFDVHNWRFTPASFKLILNDIGALGFTNLSISTFFDTQGCEFIVQLRKGVELSAKDGSRLAMIRSMLKESLDLASWDKAEV
jgi:glycosyltransferase involved in cell wall biosynthesis/ubiquinone/menaquinone biosynthesis C-methylase UbiE